MKESRYVLASLLLVLSSLIFIAIARSYWSGLTGFLTHDEGLYYFSVILTRESGIFTPVMGDRIAFQALLNLLSPVFKDVFYFLRFGIIITAFFAILTVMIVHRINKSLGFDPEIRALAILSIPLFFVFPLISAFTLTEAPALAFTMLGVYLLVISKGKRSLLALAFLSFILAASFREIFILYAMIPPLMILTSLLKRRNLIPIFVILGATAGLGWFVYPRILYFTSVYVPKYAAGSGLPFILGSTLQNFLFGIQIGWTPVLLALSVIGALQIFRLYLRGKRNYLPLILIIIIGYTTLLTEYFFTFFYDVQFASTLIRFAYAGLPAAFISVPFGFMAIGEAVNKVYFLKGLRRGGLLGTIRQRFLGPIRQRIPNALGVKQIRSLALIFVLISASGWIALSIPNLAFLSQTNLTDITIEQIDDDELQLGEGEFLYGQTLIRRVQGDKNVSSTSTSLNPFARFDFGYRSQPFLLYHHLENITKEDPSAKVLIIAVPSTRAKVFAAGFENVKVIEPPATDQELQDLLESPDYDVKLLYGELFGEYYFRLELEYPTLYRVIDGQTPFGLKIINSSYDGYIYKVER